MKVVFLSEFHGQTGVSSNACAMAFCLALQGKKVLLMDSQFYGNGLEQAVCRSSRMLMEQPEQYGLDPLLRFMKREPFSKEMLDTVVVNLYEEQLWYLPGSRQEETAIFTKAVIPYLTYCINAMEPFFDIVIIDAGTIREEKLDTIHLPADHIIVNLSQNPLVLERSKLWVDEKVSYLIGNYEKESRYSKYLIAKMLGKPSGQIGIIPHNPAFRDAFAQGELIRFLLLNRSTSVKPKKNEWGKVLMHTTQTLFEKRERKMTCPQD